MKALISDKEIANFLVTLITKKGSDADLKTVLSLEYSDQELSSEMPNIIEKIDSGKIDKFKDKIRSKLIRAAGRDLQIHIDKVQNILNDSRIRKEYVIQKNFLKIVETLGVENVLKMYKHSNEDGFVKSVGLQIDKNVELVRRATYQNSLDDCILRNTTGNENFLVDKIDNFHPFWFIDSGYTNFLEGKQKKWHRLTRNHIHQLPTFQPPVDRLSMFKEFPKPWRTAGNEILIIEPGPFSAAIFHIDIPKWKNTVESELRKYTDRPIKFRPKIDKKNRKSLYQELLNEDYYCVLNINSNAATEAVWAGIPVITLDRHITNSISRSNISEINDLARPHLANWLCMLSYSQFTYDELINGTASTIIKNYHA
jgi:hypothetical protein